MIGSDTFIIVAFKCSENSTRSFFARAIWSSKKATSAQRLITVASRISPAFSESLSLSTMGKAGLVLLAWGSGTNSIFTVVAAERVIDFSFEKKSLVPIVATEVLDWGDHAPIECGCFLA